MQNRQINSSIPGICMISLIRAAESLWTLGILVPDRCLLDKLLLKLERFKSGLLSRILLIEMCWWENVATPCFGMETSRWMRQDLNWVVFRSKSCRQFELEHGHLLEHSYLNVAENQFCVPLPALMLQIYIKGAKQTAIIKGGRQGWLSFLVDRLSGHLFVYFR